MIVKILGMIDLAGAFAFLMLIFGLQPFVPFILFCSGLLFLKGLFILTGEPLSAIDIYACGALLLSLFFSLGAIFLWVPAFLLVAKGVVSLI